MKKVYPVFIAESPKETQFNFLVYVPDMGIYTEAGTFMDAIEMARDAIGLYGITAEDEGLELPSTSTSVEATQKAEADTDIFNYSTGILTYVDVDFSEYRQKIGTRNVRRTVTLPDWLNYEAKRSGIDISRVLQDALIKTLHLENRPYYN